MLGAPWLPRRNQWNLAHLMILIACCGVLLGLSRLPSILAIGLACGASLVVGPVLMARWGYKLVDIVAVVVIALLTYGLLLPAMAQTKYVTAGKRTFPIPIPPQIAALFRQE